MIRKAKNNQKVILYDKKASFLRESDGGERKRVGKKEEGMKRRGERKNRHHIMILNESMCGRDVSIWIVGLLCGGVMVIVMSAE